MNNLSELSIEYLRKLLQLYAKIEKELLLTLI